MQPLVTNHNEEPVTTTTALPGQWDFQQTLYQRPRGCDVQAPSQSVPSNAVLLKLAQTHQPPDDWYKQETDPFTSAGEG